MSELISDEVQIPLKLFMVRKFKGFIYRMFKKDEKS